MASWLLNVLTLLYKLDCCLEVAGKSISITEGSSLRIQNVFLQRNVYLRLAPRFEIKMTRPNVFGQNDFRLNDFRHNDFR